MDSKGDTPRIIRDEATERDGMQMDIPIQRLQMLPVFQFLWATVVGERSSL